MTVLVVTGTGTGVGKTVVTAALACYARQAGIDVAVCKPVQTGTDCGDDDLGRVRELLSRYEKLGLSFTDAAVVACAERHGGAVLTLDRRDFDVVAAEGRISVVPE